MSIESVMNEFKPGMWKENFTCAILYKYELEKLYERIKCEAKAELEEELRTAKAPHTGHSGLIRNNEMKFVSKPWGWELWIVNNPLYCGKILFMKQGHHCSFHHHEIKDEVLYVYSGQISMWTGELNNPTHHLVRTGDAFHVRPGLKHQMVPEVDTYIIEFSTQHFDEDSFRTTQEELRPSHPVFTWGQLPAEIPLTITDGIIAGHRASISI